MHSLTTGVNTLEDRQLGHLSLIQYLETEFNLFCSFQSIYNAKHPPSVILV